MTTTAPISTKPSTTITLALSSEIAPRISAALARAECNVLPDGSYECPSAMAYQYIEDEIADMQRCWFEAESWPYDDEPFPIDCDDDGAPG